MNTMKKYRLLAIPLILLGQDLFPYFKQTILNMIIILILLAILLKRTTLQNILDWIIGACFSLYFCFLYMNTVEISLFYSPMNLTAEEIREAITYPVNLNLIPFREIVGTLRHNPAPLYQTLGNILMLAPLTFVMLYFKWVKSIKRAIWYSFLCTVSIELIQFLKTWMQILFGIGEGRSTDIDDVILNTTGALIGGMCYLLYSKIERHFSKQMRGNNTTI